MITTPVGGSSRASVVLLTPLQSVTLHGWMNPKRTLTWADVVGNPRITVRRIVVDAGLSQDTLVTLQPSVSEWVEKKYVSYEDVAYMTIFPLDPITHLGGDISTLVAYRYPCKVLSAAGLTYGRMRHDDRLGMDAKWMKLMNLTLREWISLGMTGRDVAQMADRDVVEVFGETRATVMMRIGVSESFPQARND